jgi:hypothetical protein
MDDLQNEQTLRHIYYNPATGYQSAQRLYEKAREQGLSATQRQVEDWLRIQDTYTRFKPVVRKHKFKKTYVSDLAQQAQLDFVDMRKYSVKNGGNRWILTGVEVLSRFAFAIPVKRKDTQRVCRPHC